MTSPALFVETAAAPHAALVRAAARFPLDTPTPCAAWDLHALLDHLLHWTPVIAAAGRKEPVDMAAVAALEERDLVVGDWPAALDDARVELVTAWQNPAAWEGATSMGGPEPLPAAMIGGMALCEIVVHGWDLGRALGLTPEWPDSVLIAAFEAMAAMAEQGREMEVFDDEVPVGPDAPALDRLVALSGRDPGWAPR